VSPAESSATPPKTAGEFCDSTSPHHIRLLRVPYIPTVSMHFFLVKTPALVIRFGHSNYVLRWQFFFFFGYTSNSCNNLSCIVGNLPVQPLLSGLSLHFLQYSSETECAHLFIVEYPVLLMLSLQTFPIMYHHPSNPQPQHAYLVRR